MTIGERDALAAQSGGSLQDFEEVVKEVVKDRIAAGNEEAVVALRKLVNWRPECGFPENVEPTYWTREHEEGETLEEESIGDYRDALSKCPFCCEAYTYEVWGKEDARSFLSYLAQIARALGLEGLHDRRLRTEGEP